MAHPRSPDQSAVLANRAIREAKTFAFLSVVQRERLVVMLALIDPEEFTALSMDDALTMLSSDDFSDLVLARVRHHLSRVFVSNETATGCMEAAPAYRDTRVGSSQDANYLPVDGDLPPPAPPAPPAPAVAQPTVDSGYEAIDQHLAPGPPPPPRTPPPPVTPPRVLAAMAAGHYNDVTISFYATHRHLPVMPFITALLSTDPSVDCGAGGLRALTAVVMPILFPDPRSTSLVPEDAWATFLLAFGSVPGCVRKVAACVQPAVGSRVVAMPRPWWWGGRRDVITTDMPPGAYVCRPTASLNTANGLSITFIDSDSIRKHSRVMLDAKQGYHFEGRNDPADFFPDVNALILAYSADFTIPCAVVSMCIEAGGRRFNMYLSDIARRPKTKLHDLVILGKQDDGPADSKEAGAIASEPEPDPGNEVELRFPKVNACAFRAIVAWYTSPVGTPLVVPRNVTQQDMEDLMKAFDIPLSEISASNVSVAAQSVNQ
jgi:hypothetical protein